MSTKQLRFDPTQFTICKSATEVGIFCKACNDWAVSGPDALDLAEAMICVSGHDCDEAKTPIYIWPVRDQDDVPVGWETDCLDLRHGVVRKLGRFKSRTEADQAGIDHLLTHADLDSAEGEAQERREGAGR